jgi:general secretion pathway protein F
MNPPANLPYQVRADLFTHLAAMEKSGLPPDKAYALLRLPGAAQARLLAMRKLLARGADPASAGSRSGLFTPLEAALLHAAQAGGSPAPTYKRLADNYALKASQLMQMKARMAKPALMLVAALFIGPLPQLAAGTLGPGAYLWHALRPMLLLAVLGMAALRAPMWFLSGRAGSLRMPIERLLLKLPGFGPAHARRNARDFFESLALLLEAGMPMFEALPTSLATINNSLLRTEFGALLPAMKRGATLAAAVVELRLIDTERLSAFVLTGEASGTLPEMLMRHVASETERINLFQQQLADWLPRIAYAVVAGWMVSQLLGGGGAPSMPPELR